MQLSIPLKTLESMVDALKDNIPKTPPQEVLTNFLIEAKNDLLTITSTDLKLWLIRREDCPDIKHEGAIALNAKRFSDMVKSLAGEDVEIKVTNAIATIKCGKSKFQLPVVAPDKYPSAPRDTDAKTFAIATDILHEGIRATLKLVSNDETKGALTAVHICEYDEVLEGEDEPSHFLSFTATDASRGSVIKFALPPLANLDIVVPVKALKEVEHIKEAETEISLSSNYIWFNSHGLAIACPLVAQKFPPVRSHLSGIRKGKKTGSVKCDRKELVTSLKRVAALTEGDIYNYLTDITVEGDNLKLVTDEGGVGRVEELLPCDVGSSGFEALFNVKYLQHILDTTKAKHVRLEVFAGARSCVLVTPCDGTDHEAFVMAVIKQNPVSKDEDDDEED